MTQSKRPRRKERIAIELPESIRLWLDWLEKGQQASLETVNAYTTDVKLLCMFTRARFRTTDPMAMTLAMLDAWLSSMEVDYAPASRTRKLNAIKSMFRWLHSRGLVPSNPSHFLASPRRTEALPRYLTPEDMQRLLSMPTTDSIHDVRRRAIIEALYSGGMRVTELATLKLDALFLQDRAVRVFGKGKRERMCFLTAPALEAMTTWLARRAVWLAQRNYSDHGYVWIGLRDRKPLTRKGIWTVVAGAGKAVGLDMNVHPHIFRHSFTTHMMSQGVGLYDLQQMLGHKSLDTTARYLHVDDARLRDVHRASHPRT